MRLIDADELLEHAYRDKLDSRELIANMIENAPTVEERQTAEWIIYSDSIQCSNCKIFYQKIRIDQKHYCPNCGAKMKGEK